MFNRIKKTRIMKYKANFYANSSNTTLINPIERNNKREIIREIIDYAKAERFEGNTARWYVWDSASGRDVASGTIQKNGRNYYDNEY